MAADTAAKRYSAMHVASPWRGLNVVPTMAIPQGERQAVLYYYSGILAGTGGPPPATIYYQGDGKTRRKRRDRRKELFDALEATIREQVVGPPLVDAQDTPIPVLSVPAVAEDLAQLKDYAVDNAILSQRLAALIDDLKRIDEAQRQAMQDDDDDWMMMD